MHPSIWTSRVHVVTCDRCDSCSRSYSGPCSCVLQFRFSITSHSYQRVYQQSSNVSNCQDVL